MIMTYPILAIIVLSLIKGLVVNHDIRIRCLWFLALSDDIYRIGRSYMLYVHSLMQI